jgi:hypothetical protein
MPNNRQWAILIWLAVAAVVLLRKPELRSSLRGLFRVLLDTKRAAVLVGMVAYVCGLLLIAYKLGIWSWDLATDTAVWFLGTALVLLFRAAQDEGDSGFFRRTATATVRWSVFVEFLMNVRVFSLPLELLLQPLLFFLLLVASFAGTRSEYSQVKRILDVVVAALGLVLFIVVSVLVIRDWDQIDPAGQTLSLALPIWLTLGFLPFLALTSIWFRLDHIYVHLRNDTNAWSGRLRGMTAILTTLGLDRTELRAFVGYWPRRLSETDTYQEAKGIVKEFVEDRHQAQEAEQERKRLQELHIGSKEVDPDGRRHDRRGFDDAKTSLMTLASFQFGYFSRTGRYAVAVADLLPASMAHLIKVNPDRIALNTNASRSEYWMTVQAEAEFHFGIAGRNGEHPTWLYAGETPPDGGIDDDDWRHVVHDPAHIEW